MPVISLHSWEIQLAMRDSVYLALSGFSLVSYMGYRWLIPSEWLKKWGAHTGAGLFIVALGHSIVALSH